MQCVFSLFVAELQRKVDELQAQYDQVKADADDRNKALEDTLEVSEKFWDDVAGVSDALKELEDNLVTQMEEPVPLEPHSVIEQQEVLHNLRAEMDEFRIDIDQIHDGGNTLVSMIGEPDRPEVERNVEDLDNVWSGLNSQWAARQKALDEALRRASHFKDQLMSVLVWLATMGEKFVGLGPIGTDTDAVMQQMEDLQSLTKTVHPKQQDLETLSQKADELTRDSPIEYAKVIIEPLHDVTARWDNLVGCMSNRMSKLQNALLSLGQFQSAIDELLGWLDRTESTLEDVPAPVYCDPKAIEIELAKLKILHNDIQAHQDSVDSVNEAGQEVIASEGGAEATTTRDKMDELNTRWDHILGKSYYLVNRYICLCSFCN